MKRFLLVILFVIPLSIFSQKDTAGLQKEARKLVRDGNELYNQQNFADAEVAYKKALANDPAYEIAMYNLGNALSQQNRGEEAIVQYELVAKTSEDKMTKAESFHNIGNTHFDAKKYKESIDAYKNSLRNNPKDDETRYNLALAQEMLDDQQQQQDQNKDNKEDKDQDKKNDDKKDDQQDKKKDQKEGDDKEDDKKDDPNQDKNKDQQQNQQPQPGKLSPQQVQQLLEAMNNEEKKTQEKMNARKEKGKKIKQEKDW